MVRAQLLLLSWPAPVADSRPFLLQVELHVTAIHCVSRSAVLPFEVGLRQLKLRGLLWCVWLSEVVLASLPPVLVVTSLFLNFTP